MSARMVGSQLSDEAASLRGQVVSARYRALLDASAVAGILALVAILYAPTLDDAFHGDDFVAFMDFKTKSVWDYSRDVFLFKDSNFYWRPFGDIFHRLLFQGFGFDAFAFRLAGLMFFLLSLICLYLFCRGERLSRLVSLGTILCFGILPNHALSVNWVTNTSRLMAGLFVLLCLVLIQKAARSRFAAVWEVAAFLCFTTASLCDEVTVALAPVMFVYGTFIARRDLRPWPAAARLVLYGALVAVVVPLQFSYTIDDELRLQHYEFGPHVVNSMWTLAAQLSLPLASGSPVEEGIHLIPSVEWGAGAVLAVVCASLLLWGSMTTRFLVVWLVSALVPFTLWEPEYLSSRYVYLAAPPFAALLSWSFFEFWETVGWLARRAGGLLARGLSAAIVSSAVAVTLALVVLSFRAVTERNASWSEETAKYGELRAALEQQYKSLPPGIRLIVVGGSWTDFWSSAVVKSLYGDKTLQVIVIPVARMDQAPISAQGKDVLVYFLAHRFYPAATTR